MQQNICIFDDELIIAMDLRQHIKKWGYNAVILKGSANDLLKHVKKNSPDLIILDIKLKGDLDGYQIADVILKEHDIPVLFVTGSGSGEFKKNFIANDKVLFIKKPFEEKALYDAVQSLIKKS